MTIFEMIPELEEVMTIAEAYKITAKEIAENGDVHHNTVSRCLKGSKQVKVFTYERVIEATKQAIEKRREHIRGNEFNLKESR
jgi:predicted transcriptional regulator